MKTDPLVPYDPLCETYEQLVEKHGLKPRCASGVDKGWINLVDELCTKLKNGGFDLANVAQVKEKFGGLRFYTDGPTTPEQQELINKAEKRSRKLCELCGVEGKTQAKGDWHITVCKPCYKTL